MMEYFPEKQPLWLRKAFWIPVILLGLIGGFAAKPLYRYVKNRRAEAMAVTVERELQAQRWQEAFSQAQAAYQLAPNNPLVIRAVARLYTKRQTTQGIALWEALIDQGAATLADRRELMQLAMDKGQFEIAEKQIQPVLSLSKEDPGDLKRISEFYLRRGMVTNALDFCLRATAKRPDDPPLKLLLGRLQLLSPVETERKKGRTTLEELSRERDRSSLEALIYLSGLPDSSRPELAFIAGRLIAHPLAELPNHLFAYALKIRIDPELKDQQISALFARYPKPRLEEKVAIGRWLNQLGAFERSLEFNPLVTALTDRDLTLICLDALGALKRWAEVRKVVANKDFVFEPWIRELFLARIAQETGETAELELYWRKVQLDVPDQPVPLYYVAQYAERAGQIADALKIYRRMTNSAVVAKEAYTGLIRLSDASIPIKTLREWVRQVMELAPGDPSAQNDLAYMDLLLKDDLVRARTVAQRLHEQNPNYLSYRITLALAYLNLKKDSEAMKLLDDLGIDWSKTLPGWQAVYVATLGANGRVKEARKMAAILPIARLRREEESLIRPYL